jgi:uncharacterized protein (TIGR00297 family)
MQVLANGGLSTLSAILYGFFGYDPFILAFGVGVAASNSDTWAGEIGILSNKRPVLITHPFTDVPHGLSGGVTLLGNFASFVGSAVISLIWYFSFQSTYSGSPLSSIVVVAISGACGSIIDSVLGATLQAHYLDKERGQLTEHETLNGHKLELARGVSWMDNDVVNLLANLGAIVIGCIAALFFK